MKIKNVAILLPDLRGGGAERVSLNLAYQIKRAGYHVTIILMQAQGEFLQEARCNFDVRSLDVSRVRYLPFKLALFLHRHRHDALLASMWPLTVVAPIICKLVSPSSRVIISEHGFLSAQDRLRRWPYRLILRASMALGYRAASQCVCVSSGLVSDVSALSGLPNEAFKVIYNPVFQFQKPSRKKIATVEALWDCPKGARIISVGSLKPVKNHGLLIRAASMLRRADARLMFLGEGDERTRLEDLATRLGIANRVLFVGFQHDPSPFYATADLFVLSSNSEGFGNVVVEALSFGLPVVSTNCPSGPAEILRGGEFGRLVPVGNAHELARAIDEELGVPVDREALIRRAEDFIPEKAGAKYLELLELK